MEAFKLLIWTRFFFHYSILLLYMRDRIKYMMGCPFGRVILFTEEHAEETRPKQRFPRDGILKD